MTLVGDAQNKLAVIDFSKLLFHSIVYGENFKHVVKKNRRPIFKNRGNGRPIVGKSKDLVFAEKYLAAHFIKDKRKASIEDPYEGLVHVIYHFHYGPDMNRNYPRTDLSNLFELVSDCLENAGVIKNDVQIRSFDGSRKYKSKLTFLEVFLLKFEEETVCPTLPDQLLKA